MKSRCSLRSGLARRLSALLRRDDGTAVIEFALASPLLMLLSLGAIKFGLVVGQHVMLTHAAGQAASALALSRGTTTPYTSTVAAITSAAPALKATSIGKTIKVNGSTCTTDAGCVALLSAGASAKVSITYACDLTVMGMNFKPNCTLSAASAQVIQ